MSNDNTNVDRFVCNGLAQKFNRECIGDGIASMACIGWWNGSLFLFTVHRGSLVRIPVQPTPEDMGYGDDDDCA